MGDKAISVYRVYLVGLNKVITHVRACRENYGKAFTGIHTLHRLGRAEAFLGRRKGCDRHTLPCKIREIEKCDSINCI